MARVTPPRDASKPAASHGPSRFSGAADLDAQGDLMNAAAIYRLHLGSTFDVRAGSKIIAERKAA